MKLKQVQHGNWNNNFIYSGIVSYFKSSINHMYGALTAFVFLSCTSSFLSLDSISVLKGLEDALLLYSHEKCQWLCYILSLFRAYSYLHYKMLLVVHSCPRKKEIAKRRETEGKKKKRIPFEIVTKMVLKDPVVCYRLQSDKVVISCSELALCSCFAHQNCSLFWIGFFSFLTNGN